MSPSALITGGGSGIGAAAAARLAQEGWEVCVLGRRAERVAAVAEAVGGFSVTADVREPGEVQDAVTACVERFGRLDALVISAGAGASGAVLDQTPERFNTVLGTNLTGAFLTARAALPHLLESAGAIVTVASLAGLRADPQSAAYCASKAGLIMLTQCLALDYGPAGVRANCVCPGWIVTEMADAAMDELAVARGTYRRGAYALAVADVPARRAGRPRGGRRGHRVAGVRRRLLCQRRRAHRRRWRGRRRRRYAGLRPAGAPGADNPACAGRRPSRRGDVTEDPHERLSVAGAAPQRVSELAEGGVRAVRLQYADLHGICRGKNIPISAFSHAAQDGIGFVAAIMTVDLRHNVVAGFEQGFPDLLARPDLTTLVALPWAPDVVGCLVDLVDPGTHQPSALDSRGALRRILTEFDALEVTPVVGPELEFYLCEPDPAAPNGHRPYAAQDSGVYTFGDLADPRGTLSRMLDAAVEMDLGAIAAAHEYGRSQFEINLRHGPALNSADPAFRYKALVKEMAARDGLLATFMGKPFNGDEGSGFHLHICLRIPTVRTSAPTRPHSMVCTRCPAISSPGCSSTDRR